MNVRLLTDPQLAAAIAYERDIESRRQSRDRLERSARKRIRLEAERVRRTVAAMAMAGQEPAGGIRRAIEARGDRKGTP